MHERLRKTPRSCNNLGKDSWQIHAALEEWKIGIQIKHSFTEASHFETYQDNLGAMQMVRNSQRGKSKYNHMLLTIYIQTMWVNFSNLQWNQKELTKLKGNTSTMTTGVALPLPQDQRDWSLILMQWRTSSYCRQHVVYFACNAIILTAFFGSEYYVRLWTNYHENIGAVAKDYESDTQQLSLVEQVVCSILPHGLL